MSSADSLRYLCGARIRDNDRAFVESLRDSALAKVAAGGGQLAPINSGVVGGTNLGRQIRLDAAEVAAIAQGALDEADGLGSGPYGFTVPDFSR